MKKLPLKYAKLEPKVFSLLLRGRHGTLLYLGVHHALDVAYNSAVATMHNRLPQTSRDEINIELWTCMEPYDALRELLEDPVLVQTAEVKPPPPKPRIIRNKVSTAEVSKSLLMQKIIDSGSRELLEESRKLLSKHEIRFVENALNSRSHRDDLEQKN